MFDTVATLYTETVSQDAMLNECVTYTPKPIQVRQTRSITRNEYYQAAAQGLKPSAVLVVFFGDYDGEKVVEWQGKIYRITRAYQSPSSDSLELTIEESLEFIDGIQGGGDNS